MKILSSLLLISVAASSLFAQGSSKDLAIQKCGECHIMGSPTKENIQTMKAPPHWSIAKKLRENFATKELMMNHIVEYTFNPSQAKMLYPKETIKRFGLMPSQKEKVTHEEAKQIALYIVGEE